ncbi:MAG: hypothetical protein KJ592_01380 [Nanoarchaeota archaeon]|nr:hypothetical protein [Nanoarchaeota archaeon]
MKMEFFADTANLDEIKYCFENGVNDGITTNPKIMESTGDLSKGVDWAYRKLIEKYPNVPISLETDLRGMDVYRLDENPEQVKDILLEQAYKLSGLANNVVIKIPISEGGLLATRWLNKEGIKTNVTACMTPYQALRASDAGATYVSLFANRMVDGHILEMSGNLEKFLDGFDWKNVVKNNAVEYSEKAWGKTLGQIEYVARKLDGTESKLIVGSIRSPADIYKIAERGPQVITIPYGIVCKLKDIEGIKNIDIKAESFIGSSINHPMTLLTLDEFEKSADKYRG